MHAYVPGGRGRSRDGRSGGWEWMRGMRGGVEVEVTCRKAAIPPSPKYQLRPNTAAAGPTGPLPADPRTPPPPPPPRRPRADQGARVPPPPARDGLPARITTWGEPPRGPATIALRTCTPPAQAPRHPRPSPDPSPTSLSPSRRHTTLRWRRRLRGSARGLSLRGEGGGDAGGRGGGGGEE